MNTMNAITVEQVDHKDVTTKFGVKPTFSFRAGGEWFKTGFKRHGLNPGDVVSFPYSEGKFGKDVEPASITKGGSSGSATALASIPNVGTAIPIVGAVTTKSYTPSGGKGVFPIPALDGQRAIVRQNALTNARELYCGLATGDDTMDLAADSIIRLARKFEAYSCGDLDMEEVEAEAAADAKKASRAKKAA